MARPIKAKPACDRVAIVMGSASDWAVMQHAAKVLQDFACPYEARVVSAHRTLDFLVRFAKNAVSSGVCCIIAGAGGAAHLPGMLAALTTLPVLGVPVPSRHLQGMDSLLSIVQMPRGVPVATFAIGEAGAANAGLFALATMAVHDQRVAAKLRALRAGEARRVLSATLPEIT